MATKAELLKKIHPQSIYHALNTALQDDSAMLADFKALTFLGRNGAGAITLTGAAAGQKVLAVAGLTAGSLGSQASLFEATITVANQLQQSSATDQSTKTFIALLI
jgi:hypothetical protein